jgi:nitrate/nitrite transporter NarK
MSNGSTFKQISQVFRAQGVGELVGPVLGWSSALASFGAFIIPRILGIAHFEVNLVAWTSLVGGGLRVGVGG